MSLHNLLDSLAGGPQDATGGTAGPSRRQLWQALGHKGGLAAGPDLEKLTDRAYAVVEELEERRRSKPWGWNSFHCSTFPGGDQEELHCGRQHLYGLVDFPGDDPIEPTGRAIMAMGNAVEKLIVYRWGRAGVTIAGSVPLEENDDYAQLGVENTDLWLKGYMDVVLDLRSEGWNSVFPLDVKGKDHDRVLEMQRGDDRFKWDYYGQIQSYIWFCREHHEDMGWADMGLQKAEGGGVLFMSRARPRTQHLYYFPYDDDYVKKGIDRLLEWKRSFLADELPDRDPSWKWTEGACAWCSLKKHVCKPDLKAGVTKLSQSHGVALAESSRAGYKFDEAVANVKRRWKQ